LFWPRMRAADASHSLSELIHKLRGKGVHIHRDEAACIWLPRESAKIDIESLCIESPSVLADRDLSILPGYSPRLSPVFADWVDEWRSDMRMRVLDEVVSSIAQSSASRDWPVTIRLADQALRIDPTNNVALHARGRAAEQLARDHRSAAIYDSNNIHSIAASVNKLRENAIGRSLVPRSPLKKISDDTPLVGREALMDRLRARSHRALGESVTGVYIHGVPGVGKSRVARELSAWMTANGAVTCTVSCGRHDAERPLSTFIQAVPRLQSLPGGAGCEPSTMACLARITQLMTDEPEMSARDDSLHRSASIRTAVIDLINAITDEQPLLLTVEDVHWIDPTSWALLRMIADTAQHAVMLLCTSRAAWQHAEWGEPGQFVVEHLAVLDDLTARDHVTNFLSKVNRSADDQYVRWCVETSGGNPYFIEELVNFWIATGQQYTEPPSLVALVEARLGCLRPDTLRVIQAAAILGKNSTIELLQQVLEFPTHTLFAAIEELGDAGLLTLSATSGEARTAPVVCRHDVVIRAATSGLSEQGQALLHHAAARAIESASPSGRSAELLWDCADHWKAAGQTERSIAAAVACARHLHDMGLVHESVKRCELALELCHTDSSRAIVLRTMAQSQYAARDWEVFCETVTRVRRLENGSTQACTIHDDLELCELNAQQCLHRDWRGALDMTLRCVRSSGADGSHRVQAAINALKLATNLGDLLMIDQVYQETQSLLFVPGVSALDRLMFTMIYHTIRGDARVSAEAARELLYYAQRTIPQQHRLTIMLNCASALRRSGLPGESEDVCESLFNTAVRLHCFDVAAEACNRLIEMHADAGRMDAANEWVSNYQRLGRPKSELRLHRSLRIAIARVHVWYGRYEAASKLLRPSGSAPLWEDSVTMFRSAALATKIRLEIGRGSDCDEVGGWIAKLAPLNESLRTVGAQDYECFSLYMGYRYVGNIDTASNLLIPYIRDQRRDTKPLSPEIVSVLADLELSVGS
jgi:hypothetical protein